MPLVWALKLPMLGDCSLQSFPTVTWKKVNCFSFPKGCSVKCFSNAFLNPEALARQREDRQAFGFWWSISVSLVKTVSSLAKMEWEEDLNIEKTWGTSQYEVADEWQFWALQNLPMSHFKCSCSFLDLSRINLPKVTQGKETKSTYPEQ